MNWIYKNGRPYNTNWPKENQERRERERKEWHAKWITVWRLKEERNWTDAAIRKYLGKPKDSNGYKIYAMDAVLKAEELPEFKAWMKKREAKQAHSTSTPSFQMRETVTVFAYARVSTLDQNTDMQEQALKAAYPDAVLRTEKASGTTRNNRPVLDLIIDMVQKGDKLVVWKLDRLARNVNDLTHIVAALESKGAALEILDQNIDTGTAAGKAFLQMLGVFAEFETNLRKERQLAGIAAAKAKGKHLGRRPSLTEEQRAEIRGKAGTLNPTELSREYGVSRATIYNVLKD